MNRRTLGTLALIGLSFLAGRYAAPDEPAHLIPVNRPVNVVTVAPTEGCSPAHYPTFPDCRVLVQEWDQNGNVALSSYVNPDDPVSRIFE